MPSADDTLREDLLVDKGSRPELQGMTHSATGPLTPSLKPSDEDGLGFSPKEDSRRFLVLVVTMFAIAAYKANDFSFTFTAICMTRNDTNWSVALSLSELSTLFAAGGIGALIATIPVAQMIDRWGAPCAGALVLAVTGVFTFALPSFAVQGGFWWIIPFRIVQGVGVATVMPLLGYIAAHWAPLDELSIFMTLLTSGIQLAQCVSMPVSGEMCVRWGWQWTFYAHGTFSVLTAFVFYWAVWDTRPASKRTKNCNALCSFDDKFKLPYKAIFTYMPVWAVWVAFLGNSFGYQSILQFMPTYLNKVLNVPIEKTGLSAFFPPAVQIVVKIIGGVICDKLTCISEKAKMIIFNSLAMVGCGAFLLPLGHLEGGHTVAAIVFFTISVGCIGLISCASMKAGPMVAKQYAHFVMAVVQVVVCVSYIGLPLFVAFVAPNNTQSEWRLVFWGVFIVLFLTNAFFCYYCDSQPAPFTKPGYAHPRTSNAEEALLERNGKIGAGHLTTLPADHGLAHKTDNFNSNA